MTHRQCARPQDFILQQAVGKEAQVQKVIA